MKKTVLMLLFFLIIPFQSYSEISTNLNIVTVMNWQTRYLMDSQTYVDADGNAVVPDDKGYATIKYHFKNRKLLKEEFLDENGKLVNCVDGYAYTTYSYEVMIYRPLINKLLKNNHCEESKRILNQVNQFFEIYLKHIPDKSLMWEFLSHLKEV